MRLAFKKMFRLSQKTDYGMILLSSFASSYAKASDDKKAMEDKSSPFISVSSIAKKHKLSVKFLSQVAQELKKAGILDSKEGISGGYLLAKDPGDIRLLDVLKVLEGDLVEGKCFEHGHKCVCGAKNIWMDIKKQIYKTLAKKTLADLVRKEV